MHIATFYFILTIMKSTDKKLLTRQTLLIKVRNQYDDASWEEFTSYYSNYIYAVLRGMGIKNDDLSDMNQTVLLKLWKNLPKFEYDPEKGSFRSWLCTIIRNSVYNYFRDGDFTSELQSEDKVESELDALSEKEWMLHIASMAWENIKNEFSQSVQDIYIRLSRADSPDIIAEETGVTRGTVYVYKERVQKALRREVRRLDRELG